MITRDEWLAALTEAGMSNEDDQGAITVEEFRAMFDLPLNTAANRMRALVRQGKAIPTHKWGVTPYGRRIQYRAYRLAK